MKTKFTFVLSMNGNPAGIMHNEKNIRKRHQDQ